MVAKKTVTQREEEEYILDGSVDYYGRRAIRSKSGSWAAGILLLVNQGLATLSFFGVGVNLVLFLTRVMGQDNSSAANNVSKWTGTVYLFSLVGAFLSDSCWGRYKTCAVFQVIFVVGLISLSLSSYMFLVKPSVCGDQSTPCGPHSNLHVSLFYLSIYLIALGEGGYQPTIATFGADQFDEDHPKESHSKVAFFSYFYLALNLGSLFSNTVLDYYEDEGLWAIGFWASTGSAFIALVLFLIGTPLYRHFERKGNPMSRFCQVIVASIRKWRAESHSSEAELYEVHESDAADNGGRKILHTKGFKFLDKAAVITQQDHQSSSTKSVARNPWRLCTVTQVEEVKCILRLLPIWLCTILYSVIFTQMTSLFVEQGDAMNTEVNGFHIPPASMSSFDIVSVAIFIFVYRRVIDPTVRRLRKSGGLTELERMGIGLAVAVLAMVSAGSVEHARLKHAVKSDSSSSLSIFWQIPQYALIGASEVFMYVGQLEFFNRQAPDGLKSFGSALCMTSISLGNYSSIVIVTIVMRVSTSYDMPGWIPKNLNKGRLDKFYFLLGALAAADLVVYVLCAKCYEFTRFEERSCVGEKKGNDLSV